MIKKLTEFFEAAGKSPASFQLFKCEDFIKEEINNIELNVPLIIYGITQEKTAHIEKKLEEFYFSKEKALIFEGGTVKEKSLSDLRFLKEGLLYIEGKPFAERLRYSFGDLVEIIRALRRPEGCPWDRAQTHKSIRENAVEEAYELQEAVDLDDKEKMLEESGDVVLQGLFHGVIAEDEGIFTALDVISEVAKKLIFRHTHIFGRNKAENAEEALMFWEKAKREEKGQQTVEDRIMAVPKTFPSVMRAEKVQKIIKKTGFDFPSVEDAFDKLYEEIEEYKKAEGDDKEKEGGDMLFAVINILRMQKIDAEIALNRTTDKFIKRFLYVEKRAKEYGRILEDCTLEEMESWYQEYKRKYEA